MAVGAVGVRVLIASILARVVARASIRVRLTGDPLVTFDHLTRRGGRKVSPMRAGLLHQTSMGAHRLRTLEPCSNVR